MSNFDFAVKIKDFESFAQLAVDAERLCKIAPVDTIVKCRTCAEMATKWIYKVDRELRGEINPNSKFLDLLEAPRFVRIIDKEILDCIHIIRKAGNSAAHGNSNFKFNDALVVLFYVFRYIDWICQTYENDHTKRSFSKKVVEEVCTVIEKPKPVTESQEAKRIAELERKVQELLAQNTSLQESLNKNKQESTYQKETITTDISEQETRKFFIDLQLKEAGWILNKDWINEYEITGMNNASGIGYIDYVLFGDDGKPLAIIEAKRYSENAERGREQAYEYCRLLQQKFGVDPIVFLTNGYEIEILNDGYHARQIYAFYTKQDLHSLMFKKANKESLDDVAVDPNICGRYYQVEAIQAVCERFMQKERKALLVMATGSGKTRTILGLIDILADKHWVKNVLFLADRIELVSQAHSACKEHLTNMSCINLSSASKTDDKNARIVFSTYQTLLNEIDKARDEKTHTRIFSAGHFDLIICDEAHRSIYNRYKAIFKYFDSLLVGLTATPKDSIDKNTYKIFGHQTKDPTYFYSLDQAVKDGYLVNFLTVKVSTNFLNNGITYANLSDEEKELFEDKFIVESDVAYDKDELDNDDLLFANLKEYKEGFVKPSDINKYVMNGDTIRTILQKLFDYGIKIDSGDRLGKTIIFARNHNHALEIKRIFDETYPQYDDNFCKVIDTHMERHQYTLSDFKDANKLPQIAVSVDMLDTGIDIPECVNLVFFKKVYSYAKFWQMIGRGTRCCKALIDGRDKDHFVIIDACDNFDFFDQNPQGIPDRSSYSLSKSIFNTKLKLIKELSTSADTIALDLADKLTVGLVTEFNNIKLSKFATQQYLKTLTVLQKSSSYKNLNDDIIKEHVNNIGDYLVGDSKTHIRQRRFDYLCYLIELAFITSNKSKLNLYLQRLVNLVKEISKKESTIKDVAKHQDLLHNLCDSEYIEKLTLADFENIRERLGALCIYIDTKQYQSISVDFQDTIIREEIDDQGVKAFDFKTQLEPYYDRINRYIKAHKTEGVINKIYQNQKLDTHDIQELERIMWQELGTKDEYDKIASNTDLGIFIREITGLDREACNNAFSKFLNSHKLNLEQKAFVKLVIDYIVENGLIREIKILAEKPFDIYTFSDVFDDMTLVKGLREAIYSIKDNAIIENRAEARL